MAAPAFASARPDDAAATHAYVRASEEYARAAGVALAGSVAAIAAEGNEIAQACPAALTYAPRDGAFEELGEEISDTLFFAGVAPMGAARLTFASAIGGLSWSDRRLTKLIRQLAAVELGTVALALPDVCADIAGWKASAYAALPEGSSEFLASRAALASREYVGPSEEWIEVAVRRLLRRYEVPAERRAMKQVERHEQGTSAMLAVAQRDARTKLEAALGAPTL